MCLSPRIILNKRYLPNKKNQGNPPECTDERKKYVSIGCGVCSECVGQRASGWKVRLAEELKFDHDCTFVTLTISDEKMDEVVGKIGNFEANAVATYIVRHFLENIRKKLSKSVKHFFITELGQDNTERLHLHGFIWGIKKYEVRTKSNLHKEFVDNLLIKEKWSYGNYYIGDYVSERTINYIVKYITKPDDLHPEYIPKVYVSKGIGSNWLNSTDTRHYQIDGKKKTTGILPFP